MLRYRERRPITAYSLSSEQNPGLPGQEQTANVILDCRPGSTKVFRVRGLMHGQSQIRYSAFAAVKTDIQEGIKHILEGIDSVLFVISKL